MGSTMEILVQNGKSLYLLNQLNSVWFYKKRWDFFFSTQALFTIFSRGINFQKNQQYFPFFILKNRSKFDNCYSYLKAFLIKTYWVHFTLTKKEGVEKRVEADSPILSRYPRGDGSGGAWGVRRSPEFAWIEKRAERYNLILTPLPQPPPQIFGPSAISEPKHTYFFKNVGLMLLFPVLTLSALLVAPNMRSCTVPWQGWDQTDKCWNNTGLSQNWSKHAYVNCLIDVTNYLNSNDTDDFASYFSFWCRYSSLSIFSCSKWRPRLQYTMIYN